MRISKKVIGWALIIVAAESFPFIGAALNTDKHDFWMFVLAGNMLYLFVGIVCYALIKGMNLISES